MGTKKRQAKRYNVFGKYPVVGVLRWMGKRGMTAEQATKALAALGIKPSGATVQMSVRQGKSGGDYELPKLEAAEQQRLFKHKKGDE